MEPILLTIPDACAALRISRSTLYTWIADGRVRPVKLGKLTRIRTSDLTALIASFEEGNRNAA